MTSSLMNDATIQRYLTGDLTAPIE
jgi:hypothetical protein